MHQQNRSSNHDQYRSIEKDCSKFTKPTEARRRREKFRGKAANDIDAEIQDKGNCLISEILEEFYTEYSLKNLEVPLKHRSNIDVHISPALGDVKAKNLRSAHFANPVRNTGLNSRKNSRRVSRSISIN